MMLNVTRRLADASGGASIGARFSRYTAGSVVAFATSEVTLILCFGTGLMGAALASVVAFLAGAIPNYMLNRSWVWKRRGPVPIRRELVPYVLVSLATLVIGALATSFAAAIAPGGHRTQTLFVAIAYFVSYGVLFVAKFAVYQQFIFGDTAGEDIGPSQPLLSGSEQDASV
jgi:putative flippase GtrA